MNIDIEKLRKDLMDYFGSVTSIYPVAIMNVIDVAGADYYKLIEIAKNNDFDLNKYVIETYTKKLFK